MAFLRSVAIAAAATALPATFALTSSSSSYCYSNSASSSYPPKSFNISTSSSKNSLLRPHSLGLVANPPAALHMDAPLADHKISPQVPQNIIIPTFFNFLSLQSQIVFVDTNFNLTNSYFFCLFCRPTPCCLNYW